MNRRRVMQTMGASLMVAGGGGLALASRPAGAAAVFGPAHPLQAAWAAWKTLCLLPEGRVVDGPQQASSHSEGQAYALTLAAAFDDIATFDLVRGWTEANLAVRPDALLSWRWKPGQAVPVADLNNASDGDLFYAWALTQMAARHDRADLAARAQATVADLVALCVVPHPDPARGLLLLPGAEGFKTDAGYLINPSYYMPRALRDLAHATGEDRLARLASDGTALIDDMAGTGMVPDWAEVTPDGWRPPPKGFSANAGYEAMRVSLFAAWSGNATSPAIARQLAAVTAAEDAPGTISDATQIPTGTPTVFDRRSGAVRERSDHAGYRAVSALVACAASGTAGAAIPPFSTEQPYYPATLHLMALVAQAEVYPQCVPI